MVDERGPSQSPEQPVQTINPEKIIASLEEDLKDVQSLDEAVLLGLRLMRLKEIPHDLKDRFTKVRDNLFQVADSYGVGRQAFLKKVEDAHRGGFDGDQTQDLGTRETVRVKPPEKKPAPEAVKKPPIIRRFQKFDIKITEGGAKKALDQLLNTSGATQVRLSQLYRLSEIYESQDGNEKKFSQIKTFLEDMQNWTGYYDEAISKVAEAMKKEFQDNIIAGQITEYTKEDIENMESAVAEEEKTKEVRVVKKKSRFGRWLAGGIAAIGAALGLKIIKNQETPKPLDLPDYPKAEFKLDTPPLEPEMLPDPRVPEARVLKEIIGEGDSIWRATRRLVPSGRDTEFSKAWRDSYFKIAGSPVHISRLKAHPGDSVEYVPGDNAHFEIKNASGIQFDVDVLELTPEDIQDRIDFGGVIR